MLTVKIEGVFIRSYCCYCNLLYKKDDGNLLANDEKIRKKYIYDSGAVNSSAM